MRVTGAYNTRQSFLGSLIKPVLSKPINTLGDVLHSTRHISYLLQKTDIFKHVEARLERSKSDLASPNDVDVVFKTREHGRYYLNTSTELGNNEGSAVCCLPLCFSLLLISFPSQQLPVSEMSSVVPRPLKPTWQREPRRRNLFALLCPSL